MSRDHADINADFLLGCSVNQEGVIVLTVSGRMTRDKLPEFSAWVSDVKATVAQVAAKHPDRVLMLSNVKKVSHFERELMGELKDLLDHNKELVTKSAIVGAHRYLSLLIDAVAKLTNRTNIQQFENEHEALSWLLRTEKTKEEAPA